MDWQPQQRHDIGDIDATSWTGTRQQRSNDLGPLYHEPRMSQLPMNLVRDNPGDGRTIDAMSNSVSTSDSVWSFDSMRNIHEFIREYNGRSYNAQNSVYFLPAGQSESRSLILQPYLSPTPQSQSFFQKDLSLMTSSTCADRIEYSRLCVPNPLASCLFLT